MRERERWKGGLLVLVVKSEKFNFNFWWERLECEFLIIYIYFYINL